MLKHSNRLERILPIRAGAQTLKHRQIMSPAHESTVAEKPAAATYIPRERVQSLDRQARPKRGKSLVGWMIGVGLCGDLIAILGGLLLAFVVRFETPMRYLGRTTTGMKLVDYRGHFVFLSVTLLVLLFHFGLYAPSQAHRLRKMNAIILTSCTAFFLGNLGLSFQLNTSPIVSRIFLVNAFVLTFFAWWPGGGSSITCWASRPSPPPSSAGS